MVATCEDTYSLVEAIDRESPDVVLSDIRMPPSGGNEGVRVAAELRETHPEIGVVILSQYDDSSLKLNLRETEDTSRRVMAALIYLAGEDSAALATRSVAEFD